MKFLLLLICSASVLFSNAQNCTSHALMRKGTQLDYMVYAPEYRNGQVLKLVFEVADVTDSAGSIISTVIKKGIGINDASNDHYERTIRLQCDGKNLLLPFDFLQADTTYFNDIFPSVKNRGYYIGAAPQKDANFVFPLMLAGVTSLPEGLKQAEMKWILRGFTANPASKRQKGESGIWINDFESVYKIKNIKVEGRETINIAAGSFECNIIALDCELQMNSIAMPIKIKMYYNNEIGIIKMETTGPGAKNSKSKTSVELISVKK